MNPSVGPQIHPHVFLVGRPPIAEYIGFVKGMALGGQSIDNATLVEGWRQANQYVAELEKSEAGIADNPPIQELSADDPIAKMLIESALYASNFKVVPSFPAVVDLDRVVVYQKSVNLTFVDSIIRTLGEAPTDRLIAEVAFGLHRADPSVSIIQTAHNQFVFISQSNDFRFLEANTIGPDRINDLASSGRPTHTVAINVGYGSNVLNVIKYKNRLLLNNGSHRAFALRKIGRQQVPCVVQNVATKDELDYVVNQEVSHNPDRYFQHVRPPMLRDFFDSHLIKQVPVQVKNRMVKIEFGIDQSDVPMA